MKTLAQTARRHAHATLSLRINKTDGNDAQGLAQLMRVGWYRETTVKGLDCRYVRSLLVVRQRLVFQITAQKNCIRGVIKGFGHIMPKALKRTFVPKIRAAIADGDRGLPLPLPVPPNWPMIKKITHREDAKCSSC